MEEIRVKPHKDGIGWSWQHVDADEKTIAKATDFEDRSSAVAAARIRGGAETVTVTRASGEQETHTTPATCRVVLLRADGSEVGELDPPPGSGVGQIITLTPVGSTEEAVNLG